MPHYCSICKDIYKKPCNKDHYCSLCKPSEQKQCKSMEHLYKKIDKTSNSYMFYKKTGIPDNRNIYYKKLMQYTRCFARLNLERYN
jgi:hypothetical protein